MRQSLPPSHPASRLVSRRRLERAQEPAIRIGTIIGRFRRGLKVCAGRLRLTKPVTRRRLGLHKAFVLHADCNLLLVWPSGAVFHSRLGPLHGVVLRPLVGQRRPRIVTGSPRGRLPPLVVPIATSSMVSLNLHERSTTNARYLPMVEDLKIAPQIPLPATTPTVPARGAAAPTRWQAIMFFGKAWVFRAQRAFQDRRTRPFPGPPPALRQALGLESLGRLGTLSLSKRPVETAPTLGGSADGGNRKDWREGGAESGEWTVAAESRSALYASEAAAEFMLQAGKVQNLRVAAAALDCLVIPRGEVFSFWRHVRRPTKARGFVPGRELREGCIIPSVGGGLCQLSNALYGAALDADCEIVERHAHSQILPGSIAAAGRDATVFWNYVDLRFRSMVPLRLEVGLTKEELVVRIHQCSPLSEPPPAPLLKGSPLSEPPPAPLLKGSPLSGPPPAPRQAPGLESLGRLGTLSLSKRPVETAPPLEASVESCETCGVTACFRHAGCWKATAGSTTAWLVDGWWPEFDAYLQRERAPQDWLFLPLDGARWGVGSYRWKTSGFARVRQAPREVMVRSLVSRRLSAQGAERQRALLRFDEALARRYAGALPFSATHLVVSLDLLPFLWRDGVLGGRTFDVLMTRQPLADLQSALDLAHLRHPESRTLGDFRVSPDVVAAEREALAEARHWVTPHREVAKLAGNKSVLLDWTLPAIMPTAGEKTRIAFPASTLGRKGAYELREVAKRLGLRITLGGGVIEDAQFWAGVDAAPAAGHWLSGARAVVLPAWVEHQPRRLLQALAAGVPVIASNACGLEGVSGVISIPEGDTAALERALAEVQAR